MKTFTKAQLIGRIETINKAADRYYTQDERLSLGLEYGWKAEEKNDRLFDALEKKKEKLIADLHEAGLCGEDGFSEEDSENLPAHLSDIYLGMLTDGSW